MADECGGVCRVHFLLNLQLPPTNKKMNKKTYLYIRKTKYLINMHKIFKGKLKLELQVKVKDEHGKEPELFRNNK